MGPVRIQVLCPDPSRLDRHMLPWFFFVTVGREVVLELDSEGPVMESNLADFG